MRSSRIKAFFLFIALTLALAPFAPIGDGLASPRAACIDQNLRPINSAVQPSLDLPLKRGTKDWGPTLKLSTLESGARIRDPKGIDSIKLMQFNVLNLERSVGKAARDAKGQIIIDEVTKKPKLELPDSALAKSPEQMKGIADVITKSDPDIATLVEVESVLAAENLNHNYLGDKYHVLLIEGNDSRGIDICLLVKKDLPFDIRYQSFKNVASREDPTNALFSRDLPIALFYPAGRGERDPPLFGVAGTHFKSQRTSDGAPDTALVRKAQAEAAEKILRFFESTHGKDFPIFLMGDYNATVPDASEFAPLFSSDRAGLTDAFDLVSDPAKTVPKSERITHTYHPRGSSKVITSQLDSISGNRAVKTRGLVIEAKVPPLLYPDGKPRPLPRSYDERSLNPSDHRPVEVVIDFRKLSPNPTVLGQ